MSKMIKIKNPETDKVEVHTVQNANDLVQHLGWIRIALVDVADGKPNRAMEPQAVIDNAKKVAKLSTGAEDGEEDGEGGEALPTEEMTAAEVAALNKG